MSGKGKINPKKVKKEKIKKVEKKEDIMTDIENDYVQPIDSYSEQLLPSNNAFIFSQEDEDFKRILELSRKEFEENHIYNKNYLENSNFLENPSLDSIENNKIKLENIEQENIEQGRIEQGRIEQGRIEQGRIEQERIEQERIEQGRIEQERIEQERIEQERIEQGRIEQGRIEQERIEQERIEQGRIEQERIEQGRIEQGRIEEVRIEKLKIERKNSLLNFSNRINKLIHVKEDKKIKELIDNILEKYFNLEIDTFKLNKKDYMDLYKIIDTYYEIPFSKNLKTAITKEENELVKNIFLK